MLVRSESRTHDLPRHSPVHSQVSSRCDLPRHIPVHNQVSNRCAVLRGFAGLLSRMWYSLSGKPRRSSIPSGNISVTSYLVSGSASQELYPNLKASVTHHPPQLTIPSERWTSRTFYCKKTLRPTIITLLPLNRAGFSFALKFSSTKVKLISRRYNTVFQ